MTTAADDDDDSISLTSTVSDYEGEYIVDQILAEREVDGVRELLVKWEGYPDERSTWEPEENFKSTSLEYWREDFENNLFGDDDRAEEVEQKMEQYAMAKLERKRRRQFKRERLGLLRNAHAHDDDRKDLSESNGKEKGKGGKESEDDAPILQARQNRDKQSMSSIMKLPARAELPSLPPTTTLQQQKQKQKQDLSSANKKSDSPALVQTTLPSRPLTGRQSLVAGDRSALNKNRFSGSLPQLKTSLPKDTQSTSSDWIHDYKITSGGNFRPKKNQTANAQKPLHTRNSPDKDALNLRPAEQWTSNADLKNYPVASRSNVDASRQMTKVPGQQSAHRGDEIQTIPEETVPTAYQPQEAILNPMSPLKRATEEPLGDSKRIKTNETEPPLKEKRTLPDGLWFYKGEILAHLFIEKQIIGPARLLGFDGIPWLFTAIVKSKAPRQQQLDLAFHNIKVEHFQESYRGLSWSPYALGCVIACETSEPSISLFVEHLEFAKEASYCSLPKNDVSLFLYSPKTPEWQFLRQNSPNTYPNADLLVVATKAMRPPINHTFDSRVASPTMQAAGHLRRSSEDQVPKSTVAPTLDPRLRSRRASTTLIANTSPATNQTPLVDSANSPKNSTSTPASRDRPAHRSSTPAVRLDHSLLIQTSPRSSIDGEARTATESSRKGSPLSDTTMEQITARKARDNVFEDRIPHLSEKEDPFLSLKSPDEVKAYFKNQYNITFEDLLAGDPWRRDMQIFCLYIGRNHRQEYKHWKRFLEACGTLINDIYEGDERGWRGFYNRSNTLSDASFYIIVHEKESRDFGRLFMLADLLVSDKTVKIYKTYLAGKDKGGSPLGLTRLFPSGGAVLLTEATMTKEPDLSLSIIRWFVRQVQSQRNETWRLYMRPRVNVWLMNKAKSVVKDDEMKAEKYFNMIIDIARLFPPGKAPLLSEMPAHIHSEADYDFDGTSTHDGDPVYIVSPASLERYGMPSRQPEFPLAERDEHRMMEFYAGSAISKAREIRKWYAVTPISLKLWKSFTHLKIMTPEAFCTEMQIGEDGRRLSVISKSGSDTVWHTPQSPEKPLKE